MTVDLREAPEELLRKIHIKRYAPIKDRLRSVLLAAQKKSARAIGEMLGYARSSIERWVTRYQQGGEDALWDRPRPGQKKKLSAEQEEKVWSWVEQGPSSEEGRGRNRLEDIRRRIQEEMDVHLSLSWVQDLVVHRGCYRLLRARPVHEKNDKATWQV